MAVGHLPCGAEVVKNLSQSRAVDTRGRKPTVFVDTIRSRQSVLDLNSVPKCVAYAYSPGFMLGARRGLFAFLLRRLKSRAGFVVALGRQ